MLHQNGKFLAFGEFEGVWWLCLKR